jgi:hypothetical protein
MDVYTAVGIADGFIESDSDDQVIEAWQFLVDTGICWQLQGYFGRMASDMIEAGLLTVPNSTKGETWN